jgi:hypothetical protein
MVYWSLYHLMLQTSLIGRINQKLEVFAVEELIAVRVKVNASVDLKLLPSMQQR